MAKYLNDTGLARVWARFQSWAANMFAPLAHDHVINLEGSIEGVLPIAHGGTGATTAVQARKALKIQCGYVSQMITISGSTTHYSVTVAFPTPFDAPPLVFLTGESNSSGRMNGLVVNVGTCSASGFIIDLFNTTSGSNGTFVKGIHWLAIEN